MGLHAFSGACVELSGSVLLDGVEELIVALHDIAEVLHRPALARLAKIGGVAEEVATAAPAAHGPDKATGTSHKPAPRTAQRG